MDYHRLFESVCHHMKGLGIACEFLAGKAATGRAITTLERKIEVRLPGELREFYRTVGNGVRLHWEADPEDSTAPSGFLSVPTLSALAEMSIGWRKFVLYSPESAEKYGFPHTKDPALAKRTAARMGHWLPVVDLLDGDFFCLDLGDPGGPVVFDKHDWMDGGSGANGHPVAGNWGAFMAAWAGVCFQAPKDLYWPFSFRPGGGIEWAGKHFDGRFRVAGLAESGGAA